MEDSFLSMDYDQPQAEPTNLCMEDRYSTKYANFCV